jgi:hypothetical protein
VRARPRKSSPRGGVFAADSRIAARLKVQTVDAVREYPREEQTEIDRLVVKTPR